MYMYNICIRRLSVMLLNQNKFWKKHFLFVAFIYDKVCDPVYICTAYKCNNGESKSEIIQGPRQTA